MFNVKGSIVALVTPFHEDGSVNFDKLKEFWNGMWKTERMVFWFWVQPVNPAP